MSKTSNNSYLNKTKSLSNTRETRITTNELKTTSSQFLLTSTPLTKTKKQIITKTAKKIIQILYFLKHQKHLSFILHENELIGESNFQNRLKI